MAPFLQALGEGMNGYRPIVELMNTNFGIYGMAELSSAGNTYATTGGQFDMPMTIIGAGGTAPNQSLGAEHSQVCVRAPLPPTHGCVKFSLVFLSHAVGFVCPLRVCERLLFPVLVVPFSCIFLLACVFVVARVVCPLCCSC